MNIKDFAKAMAGLQEVFTPEKPLSKEKVEIYYQIFKKWTIEEFNNACFSLLKTKKISTFPLPAEIEEAKQGVLDDNTKAVLAYDKFTRGKARTGIYESVVFDDKNIHAVVQSMGGWHDVCLITEDEWRFKRKEFLDLYKALSKNPRTDIPERLVGIRESEKAQFGEKIGEPIYIGDERKQIEN